jgi:hypothetical protein
MSEIGDLATVDELEAFGGFLVQTDLDVSAELARIRGSEDELAYIGEYSHLVLIPERDEEGDVVDILEVWASEWPLWESDSTERIY